MLGQKKYKLENENVSELDSIKTKIARFLEGTIIKTKSQVADCVNVCVLWKYICETELFT